MRGQDSTAAFSGWSAPRPCWVDPGQQEAETVWEGGRHTGRRSPVPHGAPHLQGPARQPTSAGESKGQTPLPRTGPTARNTAPHPHTTVCRAGPAPAGLRVQTGTAGGARSQENCRDAELQGGQRGCLKTHRSPGPRGSARRKLAAPGQRLSQHPPTSTQDGSGHSADRRSQGRRTAPGSDPRWAGREAKHTGPALGSLRLMNKPASHWKH